MIRLLIALPVFLLTVFAGLMGSWFITLGWLPTEGQPSKTLFTYALLFVAAFIPTAGFIGAFWGSLSFCANKGRGFDKSLGEGRMNFVAAVVVAFSWANIAFCLLTTPVIREAIGFATMHELVQLGPFLKSIIGAVILSVPILTALYWFFPKYFQLLPPEQNPPSTAAGAA